LLVEVFRAEAILVHGRIEAETRLSLRLMKGVYYRIGAHRGERVQTEYLSNEGTGDLIVTDRALYFLSSASASAPSCSLRPVKNESMAITSAVAFSWSHRRWLVGVPEPRNPIVGSFSACCARAATGHAAAPPMSVMKSRLLIR
jgi:hypothetical protein